MASKDYNPNPITLFFEDGTTRAVSTRNALAILLWLAGIFGLRTIPYAFTFDTNRELFPLYYSRN